ncbi:low molecular weight protein-tyrosine-phosphatase [Amphibacillus cookii]|uniref:low molecular weight protein-tyrosine-phosphatase n=1 Tax=Amphibacillus cookii TaxID=767787 RepID=UPI00195E4915|nr:low molecular weight protein-tyrosine-phosphatase [Amphibacillus cookii]MBM7542100.1 protein-tyrosine phosphatase [Amphibacillus cookii]
MIKVLFVCLGNICRSPMAEAYFRHLVKNEGLADRFVIDSGGMGSWHTGKPPHHGTQTKLDEKQISYQGITARQVTADDLDEFDYVIAMDDQNISDLTMIKKEAPAASVAKLMDYLNNSSTKNVPDPYFTGDFDQTYALIEAGCQALLDEIKKINQLN